MDLEEQLSKALSDPDIMNKVGSILSSLGDSPKSQENKGEKNSEGQSGGIQNILGNIKDFMPHDDRTNLLLALKPFLSEKRAPYMDSAITILSLVNMGKLSKDMKLF